MGLKEKIGQILNREPKSQAQGANGNFDFLAQIKADYGIEKVGERDFRVVVNGMEHVGPLSHVMNIAQGKKSEDIGVYGNP